MSKGLFRDLLGGFIIAGFVGSMIALFFLPVPEKNHDLIVFMLGQLSGFTGAVIGYHYHTNASSARKTDLLAKAEPIMENVLPLTKEDEVR